MIVAGVLVVAAVVNLATAEGLEAHARSVALRLEDAR